MSICLKWRNGKIYAHATGVRQHGSSVSPSDVLRLKNTGVSLDDLIQWRNLYSGAINKGGITNFTAIHRMNLMKKLIELW